MSTKRTPTGWIYGAAAATLLLAGSLWYNQAAGSPPAADAVAGAEAAAPLVTVYKSPTCGCCEDWAAHLVANGFEVKEVDVADMGPVKTEHGVPNTAVSCHTAVVDGYVVEGHVPADAIKRLLTERPDVRGLAVPGMPVGSPGMEMGDRKDPYDILTFDRSGRTSVFERR